MMFALTENKDVYDTTLTILHNKGYRLWRTRDDDFDEYCAEKNGWDFIAFSPCSLLGLITIYEWQSPVEWAMYWWRENDELDIDDKLTEEYNKIDISYERIIRK